MQNLSKSWGKKILISSNDPDKKREIHQSSFNNIFSVNFCTKFDYSPGGSFIIKTIFIYMKSAKEKQEIFEH